MTAHKRDVLRQVGLAAVLAPLSFACRTPDPAVRIETEWLIRLEPRSSGPGAEGPRELARGGSVIHATRERTWIRTNTLERDEETGEPIRHEVTALHETDTGIVWTRVDDEAFERVDRAESAYLEAGARRRRRTELARALLYLPLLSEALSGESGFSGPRLLARPGRAGQFAGQSAEWKHLALAPGLLLEVLVSEDSTVLPESWQREAYARAALGWPVGDASRLLALLGGFPARSIQRDWIGPDGVVTVEHSFSDWAPIEIPPPFLGPSAKERLRAHFADESLRDPRTALDLLSRWDASGRAPDEIPEAAISKTALVLGLERALPSAMEGEVLGLLSRLEDPILQVEVARLILRRTKGSLPAAIRDAVRGPDGTRAMNVAEALLAEDHPSGLAAVFEVLSRRLQYGDPPPDVVALWATGHLGFVSGVPPDELRSALDSSERRDLPGDPAEGLSRELDFWLRWWERRRASFPAL